MNITPELLSYISVWIANAIYFLSLFPQMLLDYKLKTVNGINDLTLFGLVLGYIAYWYHIYFQGFPLPYQALVPLSVLASFIIVIQSFYYDGYAGRRQFIYLYLFLIVFSGLLLPIAFKYPVIAAILSGWLYFVIWLLYMLPQIYKIYTERSVRGFSYGYLTFLTIGLLMEFIAGFFIKLSLQLFFNCLRGIVGYLIFSIFFYIYRDNR